MNWILGITSGCGAVLIGFGIIDIICGIKDDNPYARGWIITIIGIFIALWPMIVKFEMGCRF